MIKKSDNNIFSSFFIWYTERIIKKNFQNYSFTELSSQSYNERSLLVLANHSSWWDHFILYKLNTVFFRKKFHVLLTSEENIDTWYYKYLGAFNVQKKSKSFLETLEYARELLKDKNNLVLIYPEGKMQSSHAKSIVFDRSIMHLIRDSQNKFNCVFASLLYDNLGFKKGSIHVYLRNWEVPEYTTLQILKSDYNKHYEASKKLQSNN